MMVVVVMVVLLVVLQAGGVTRPQLGQSAAGRGELWAQVSHLLAGWLDGPIDPLSQLLVVLHHFQDFPLRSKSTKRHMVSSTLSGARRSRCSSLSPFIPLLPQFRENRHRRGKNPKCALLQMSAGKTVSLPAFCYSESESRTWGGKRERACERMQRGDETAVRSEGDFPLKNPLPAAAFREDTVHWKMTCSLLTCSRNVPCAPSFWGERGRDLKYNVFKTRGTAALDFEEASLYERFVLGK